MQNMPESNFRQGRHIFNLPSHASERTNEPKAFRNLPTVTHVLEHVNMCRMLHEDRKVWHLYMHAIRIQKAIIFELPFIVYATSSKISQNQFLLFAVGRMHFSLLVGCLQKCPRGGHDRRRRKRRDEKWKMDFGNFSVVVLF